MVIVDNLLLIFSEMCKVRGDVYFFYFLSHCSLGPSVL